MQQRYYDPIAGRFQSVDPVTTDAGTGGHFNRYVYGNINPYRFIDPDGREPHPVIDRLVPRGDIIRTTGESFGALAAYAHGAISGSEALKSAALEGMRENVTSGDGVAAASMLVGGLSRATRGETLLFRRGGSDTKALLQRDAQVAERNPAIGIHGVSVSTSPAAKPGQVVRCATCRSVETDGFKVQQTGRDPDHHTVELPKPITPDVVRRWNELFK